jgi:lycopene beta-cyclase
MYRQGGTMAGIFTDLFRNNPIDRIFRFLDETGSVVDNLQLMTSLPVKPFVEALWKIKVHRRL